MSPRRSTVTVTDGPKRTSASIVAGSAGAGWPCARAVAAIASIAVPLSSARRPTWFGTGVFIGDLSPRYSCDPAATASQLRSTPTRTSMESASPHRLGQTPGSPESASSVQRPIPHTGERSSPETRRSSPETRRVQHGVSPRVPAHRPRSARPRPQRRPHPPRRPPPRHRGPRETCLAPVDSNRRRPLQANRGPD